MTRVAPQRCSWHPHDRRAAKWWRTNRWTVARLGQDSGIAKGAGMIGPNMATMLACPDRCSPATASRPAVLQDGRCELQLYQRRRAHEHQRYPAAAGQRQSGWPPLARRRDPLAAAVKEVCIELARMIPDDGEGASHLVTIDVNGCANVRDARQIAQTVANSAAGQNRRCRSRSELGPYRFGRRLRPSTVRSRAASNLRVNGTAPLSPRRTGRL